MKNAYLYDHTKPLLHVNATFELQIVSKISAR